MIRYGKNVANGYSLIELMVALTIGLIILGAVITLFATSRSNYGVQEDLNALQENGRYAIRALTDDIHLAGYIGVTYDLNKITPAVYGGAVTDACDANWVDISQPIYGENAASATGDANTFTGCIPSSQYKTGTDILVVRHASSFPAPSSSTTFDANRIYLHTELDRGNFFTGAAPDPVTYPASDYEMDVHVYYIRPYATKAGDGIPTLVRETLVAGPAMVAQALAEGVENMQISYGVDTTASPGDGVVDMYVSADGVANWSQVVSVRIDLLVRAPTKEGGYTDTNSYPLGDYTVAAPNDTFRRRIFSSTIQLRNHPRT